MPPDPHDLSHRDPSAVAQKNIRTVAELEREAARQRSFPERASEAVAAFMGSMKFVLGNAILVLVWVLVNVGFAPGIRVFDPYPFGILVLLISTEAVFLALFVLISQNRMTREVNHRAHLDLQIGMLAEAEITKVLEMLHDLRQRMGFDPGIEDEELKRLAEPTHVPSLAKELKKTLPDR